MQRKWIIAGGLWVVGMALSISSAWAASVPRQAEVSSAAGQVEWLKSGEATWQAASAGQKLGGGDKVRTGENSEAVLMFDDESKIQLFADSEFSIQTLTKNSASEELESVLAIMKGKLRADVTPLKGGSKFEIETPAVVAAVRGTTLFITINPDGTVSITSDSGAVELIHRGENNFTALLGNGEEAAIDYNPASGVVKVTSISGSFDVKGPDGDVKTLNEGDTVIFGPGPATFVPGGPGPTNDAPVTETQSEPASA